MTSGPSLGGKPHGLRSSIPQFQVSSISVLSSPSHGYEPFSFHPNLHIIVKIKLWSGKDWIQTYAMIDSSASTSFIDIRWAKRRIPHLLNPKSTPFKVSLGDGEFAKTCRVTEEVQARIAIGEHEESNLCLSATKLSYPIMLGISWLKQHDPWTELAGDLPCDRLAGRAVGRPTYPISVGFVKNDRTSLKKKTNKSPAKRQFQRPQGRSGSVPRTFCHGQDRTIRLFKWAEAGRGWPPGLFR